MLRYSDVFGRIIAVGLIGEAATACSSMDSRISEGASRKTQAPLIGVVEGSALISPALAAQIAISTDDIETVLFLTRPVLDEGDPESGAAEFGPNGQILTAELNGMPSDADGVAANAEAARTRIAARDIARRAARSESWRDLAAKYGIQDSLKRAIEEGASNVQLVLPKQVLLQLAEDSGGHLRGMTVPATMEPGTNTLASALASTGLSSVAFPNGFTGSGLGIYLTDLNDVEPAADCVNPSNLNILGVTGTPASHATVASCFAQKAAPGAVLNYNPCPGYVCAALPSSFFSASPPLRQYMQRPYQSILEHGIHCTIGVMTSGMTTYWITGSLTLTAQEIRVLLVRQRALLRWDTTSSR